MLDQQFRGLRDALSGMQPGAGSAEQQAANQAVKQMLADLNTLLAKHARGQDTSSDFEQFMAEHGDLFPEDPKDVDELIDALARRAAASERLMQSLTPQQREELQGLMAAALGDPELAAAMAQLSDSLRALRPDLAWQRGERMRGDQPLGYGEAAGALGELADLDELIEALSQDHPGATLDDVDVDVETVERALGTGAATDVRALQQLERELERQGWLVRGKDGLQLSPKSLRRLGQTALRQVFEHLREGGRGQHDVRDAGASGEATGASRQWEFGDEQALDVVRTVSNALRRNGSRPEGTSGRVQLEVGDFEVVETERRSSASVALCVDLSYSMIAEGRWGPMKQTALALAQLVATRFPQDSLQIIGFGLYASKLSLEELAGIEPDYVQGTNLHHALALAGRHLRRHSDGEPVVLVVTDGEPTAHLGGERACVVRVAADPPDCAGDHRRGRCPDAVRGRRQRVHARGGRGAAAVHGRRRERNGGRVFTPSLDRLGTFVVSDYLRARRGRGGGR